VNWTDAVEKISSYLTAQGLSNVVVRPTTPTIEDVFIKLTLDERK
jgi:hypothetical protein